MLEGTQVHSLIVDGKTSYKINVFLHSFTWEIFDSVTGKYSRRPVAQIEMGSTSQNLSPIFAELPREPFW